jgi:uncharacterized membrane protein
MKYSEVNKVGGIISGNIGTAIVLVVVAFVVSLIVRLLILFVRLFESEEKKAQRKVKERQEADAAYKRRIASNNRMARHINDMVKRDMYNDRFK